MHARPRLEARHKGSSGLQSRRHLRILGLLIPLQAHQLSQLPLLKLFLWVQSVRVVNVWERLVLVLVCDLTLDRLGDQGFGLPPPLF